LLLIYTFTAGLLIPLKPGVHEVSQSRLDAGESLLLEITGYNTFFTREPHRVFLRISDTQHIEATNVGADGDQTLNAYLNIPSEIDNEVEDATLIVSNSDSYFIYPSMTVIRPKEQSETNSRFEWSTNEVDVPKAKWKFQFPNRAIIEETVRNTFFHVAIWMAQFFILTVALWNSILYLRRSEIKYDQIAAGFTYVALVYGLIGVVTGSIWARFTWGAFWTNDVKLNMTTIAMMIYFGYGLLRSSIDDYDKRARTSAVFNVFAYAALMILVMVLPRLTDSLHPGNGGNPAFGSDDMDNTLRMVFYPAIIALILIGSWIAQLIIRSKRVEERMINRGLED